jgi:hypothetical protein
VGERSGAGFLVFCSGGGGRWVGELFSIMWDMFYDLLKYGVLCACVHALFDCSFVH